MGVTGGIRPSAKNLAHMAEQIPERAEQLGGHRHQPRPVASHRGRRGARGEREGGARGQLLPARWRDGALQRRADREGAARSWRTPGGAPPPWRRRASCWAYERALGRPGPGPLEAAARWLLLAAPGRLRRRGAEGRGHRNGRLHPLVAALPRGRGGQREVRALPLTQPRQALDPVGSEERGRQGGAAAAGARVRRGARVLPSRRNGASGCRLRDAPRAEPPSRLLRDHGLRAGRPLHGALGPRHELPRPERPARAHRRAGRATGAVGRPDRGPRRRRAHGGVRDHGGAARARALGGGPARGRVDVRRLALLARDGGRAVPGRRSRAAARRTPARGRADLLPAVRVQGRLGHARRARAEVLAGVVPRRGARGPRGEAVRGAGLRRPWRGRARLPRADPRRVERVRLRARLLPRAGARPRRGARLRAGARTRDGGGARPTGRRGARAAARRAREAVANAGRAGGPGPGFGRAHPRGACVARLQR